MSGLAQGLGDVPPGIAPEGPARVVDDGESVGWSRPGMDPVEEGRDSAGQGAG